VILLAFDKFRGAADAGALADAAEGALRAVRPEAPVGRWWPSDGGEGFLEALARGGAPAAAASRVARARDAAGQWRDAVAWRASADGRTACVETSLACGWGSLPEGRAAPLDPMGYATWGAGDLIRAAVAGGAREVLLGLGGSCSTDGGLGALEALGCRLWDAHGRPLAASGEALSRLARIEPPEGPPPWPERLVLAHDVRHAYAEAAPAFAPQKGASPDQVARLAEGLERAAGVLETFSRTLGGGWTPAPGTGSCGGLAGGLAALPGAVLRPGLDAVAEATGLDALLARAEAVLTGEGRVDAGSARGKAVGALAVRAARFGVPVYAFCGSAEGPPEALARRLGLAGLVVLSPEGEPLERSLARTRERLAAAVAAWAAETRGA
jgi:glycerate kinase